MSDTHAALDAEALARLGRVTREYGELGQRFAGGTALLGGVSLLVAAWVEAAGHGWRLLWMGGYGPLSLRASVGMALAPLVWLVARALMAEVLARRFGRVVPLHAEPPSFKARLRRVMGRFGVPGVILAISLTMVWTHLPGKPLRVVLLACLSLSFHIAFPRLRTRAERGTAVLLFLAPAFALGGIQMAAADAFLAYPVVGVLLLMVGVRDLARFRRFKRELKHLGGVA